MAVVGELAGTAIMMSAWVSGPIALAAVRLFTEGDFHRIRECGGHACGWLFYDRSKNNRRRWCEMEVCGNRAKQRRLAARRREA